MINSIESADDVMAVAAVLRVALRDRRRSLSRLLTVIIEA